MAEAKPQHTNRLSKEKSPYLLQHAHNPVDWYAWGEEAFEKARKENKPVFLSIGYSTCHWCHVMERESFEDPATAELLNTHYVSIKVDREERPDVDALYMQAVMQMTGQGGWPLSVFLTPDKQPFYGGTYFPPEARWGHPGFKDLLRGIADAWETRRDEVLRSGKAMTEALQAQRSEGGVAPVSGQLILNSFRAFSSAYDERKGGFLPAPKFPRSHALSLLLRHWKRSGDAQALQMVEKTLQEMAAGGLYDQVGGGFHRYSTDAEWHIPHFEKMLYDQALLARTYLEAYQSTGNAEYARVAREIFEYVRREMTDKKGGFYSAEDADSLEPGGHEKREGAFYVWTAKELEEVLGNADAEIYSYLFGAMLHGNAAQDPQGEFIGKNILYRAHTAAQASAKFNRPETEIAELEQRCRKKLFDVRAKRPRPHLDDKVLADWNGLMISSLAFGSRVLEEPAYAEAAKRAADFILENMVVHPEQAAHPSTALRVSGASKGRLLHRYRDGEAAVPGYLEDYAFFVHGLVDLYEATFDRKYLDEAKRLTLEMARLFWDEQGGGFYQTGSDAEQLLVRQKELYDGAIPSGNSVAALDLIRVARLTGEKGLEEEASKLMESFGGQLNTHPTAFPQLLIALDFGLGPSYEVVLAGEANDPLTRQMLKVLYGSFLPNKVVTAHPPGGAPFPKVGGKTTAYVCQNYACNLPTSDPGKLKELLAVR